MPRTPRVPKTTEASVELTAITAAATNYSGPYAKKRNDFTRKNISAEPWQDDLWIFYDSISELRYAANWVGNLLSKAELYVARNGKRLTSGPAFDALQQLYGGPDEQPEMLRLMGIHFTVPGECYLTGLNGGRNHDDEWDVVAATEMSRSGSGYRANNTDFGPKDIVMRLWKPHPRKRKEPDSPARAVYPIFAELDGLTKMIAGQIDSRLAGAGLLAIPSELSFASGPTTVDGKTSETSSAAVFMQMLVDAMMTPLGDRSSPAALVPLLLQGPGEFLDKIRWIKNETLLEQQAIDLREEAIKRIAIGMDMPPEVLTGTAGMNHWGAWQADEAGVKIHTEPLLKVITSSLTTGYLRKYLRNVGVDEDEVYETEILADTSALRVRPNRSKEALELYNLGELSSEALLRENGFEPDDRMTDAERVIWLLKRLTNNTTTPEIVAQGFEQLGVPLELPAAAAPEVDNEPDGARAQPSIAEHPVRELPARTSEAATLDAAAAYADVLVYRALERCGNRFKTRHGSFPAGVIAADFYLHSAPRTVEQIDDALADAWAMVERFDVGMPTAQFVRALNAYTRTIIRDQRPHDPNTLRRYLGAVLNRDRAAIGAGGKD